MNTMDKSIDELMELAAALIVRSIEAEEAAEAAEKEKNRVAEERKRVSEQEKEVKKRRKMQDWTGVWSSVRRREAVYEVCEWLPAHVECYVSFPEI